MIQSLRSAAYRHGYLIIIAAWLFTISLIVARYAVYNVSPEKVQNRLESILNDKEEKFNDFLKDTNTNKLVYHDSLSKTELDKLTKLPFGLFVFKKLKDGGLSRVFWNNNHYYTDIEQLNRSDGIWFQNLQNGDFVIIRKTANVDGQLMVIAGVIPVRWDYFIENKYLAARFEDYPGLIDAYEISNDSLAFHIHSLSGQDLFKIKLKEGRVESGIDFMTIFLRTLSVLFLFFYLNAIAKDATEEHSLASVFPGLVMVTVLVRTITYLLPFPFDLKNITLFDPSVYASDFLHRSLGDLLINTLIFYWLIDFYRLNQKRIPVISKRSKAAMIFGAVNIVVLVMITFYLVSIIRSLVLDSKISFNVTNIFSLNIFSIISLIIMVLIVIAFFQISHLLLRKVYQLKYGLPMQLLIMVITGFIFLSCNLGKSFTLPDLAAIGWLLLYLSVLHYWSRDQQLSIVQSSYFIFWVMFFCLSVILLVVYENNTVEMQQRKRIAEQLALQADPSGESLLTIAATDFNDKFLSDNYKRLQSEYSNKFIKDSLIDQNFSGYLNKYDTRIYTFTDQFSPLFNDDSTSYTALKAMTEIQGKATGISGLYTFISNGGLAGYIFQKTIQHGEVKGYLFIIVRPKKYVSEALFPELFKQTQDISSDLNTDYIYAVYNYGRLISKYNNYDFPLQLSKAERVGPEFVTKEKDEYDELWYNAGNGKQVLVARKNDLIQAFIALFAYLFCVFLAVIFMIRLIQFFIQAKFKWSLFKKFLKLNIRGQINATIISVSIFSFLVIGLATVSFFIIRFNRNHEERLIKSLEIMTSELENRIRSGEFKQLHTAQSGNGNGIEKVLSEISETHGVDVNYFNTDGILEVSTQPYIYNKHLLGDEMEPVAFYQLSQLKKSIWVQQEKIGNLQYISIYSPVMDENGKIYAYLNIPYLNSQVELNQEISGFLATLINLNAFTFLIAGAIAFLITSKITSSFRLISNKMKQVSLGKDNEIIDWKGKDEIGILVNEYNKMVRKLEESAKALAQNEREMAWREMARQVAHEIKNPLTPMKLSIQYLQRAIDSGANNVKELSQQVAGTLIEQIDQLATIAGDFSQFANINNVRMEQIDIRELLTSLVGLYRMNRHVVLDIEKTDGSFVINADKVQINRLFTNLLKNAVEATEDMDNAVIRAGVISRNGIIRVSVSDNGKGIPDAVKDKIFIPNFTSKSSGTGLGLAICKGIVEKANGRIWFDTIEHTGTSFYVELPSV